MSRCEMLIIIAIVNIALFGVLLVTAERLEELPAQSINVKLTPTAEMPTASILNNATIREATISSSSIPETAVDEVDNVLRDFAATVAASQQKQTATSAMANATTLSAEASSSSHSDVIVKRGDFLEKIARQHGSTVEAIKQANHLTNDNLKVGQILRIPQTHVQTEPLAASPSIEDERLSKPQAAEPLYRIKSGDNPWKIAKQLHISVEELLRLNGLDEHSARNLKPGDIIRTQ